MLSQARDFHVFVFWHFVHHKMSVTHFHLVLAQNRTFLGDHTDTPCQRKKREGGMQLTGIHSSGDTYSNCLKY